MPAAAHRASRSSQRESGSPAEHETTWSRLVDHLLSTFVFVAYLVEFLLVQAAAHQVFFILMLITFIEVLAGFSVSLRAAGRDVNFE